MTLFICSVLFSMGLFFLLAEFMHIPSRKTVKNIMAAGKSIRDDQAEKSVLTYQLASSISKLIRINPYKYKRTSHALKSIGMNYTPEVYYGMAFIKLLFWIILTVLFLVLLPILAIGTLIVGLYIFFNHLSKPDKMMAERRLRLEAELPIFASIIEQEIKKSKNILEIMEYYQVYAGKELKEELLMTIADMKSSNQEGALLRLESRVGSPELAEITRGLISVLRGDDGCLYFTMLVGQFRAIEVTKLKKTALKVPGKINKYSMFILIMFVVTIFVVIGGYLMTLIPAFI